MRRYALQRVPVCFMFALLVPILAGCLGDSEREGGPLREPSEGGSGTGAPVKRGQFLVIGVAVPKNTSGDEAVLDRIEPTDSERVRGLELRFAAVRTTNRTCRVGAMRDWPPLGCAGELEPVKGFHVPRGTEALILAGARSSQLGRWNIPGFRLHYRTGSRRYQTTYRQRMELRVVGRLSFAESSAAFSSFRTEDGTIGCAYLRSSGLLRCERGGMFCMGFEMRVTGSPREACAHPVPSSAQVVRARETWLYRGFRCYVGHASVRCRNQVFKGFFIDQKGARGST